MHVNDDAISERWTWDGGLYPAVVDEPPDDEIGHDEEEEYLPPVLFSVCFIIDGVHFDPDQADMDEPPDEKIGHDEEEEYLPPALFSKVCVIIDGFHFDPDQADMDIVIEELVIEGGA